MLVLVGLKKPVGMLTVGASDGREETTGGVNATGSSETVEELVFVTADEREGSGISRTLEAELEAVDVTTVSVAFTGSLAG